MMNSRPILTRVAVGAIVAMLAASPVVADITMTFEHMIDQQLIGTGYAGVSFVTNSSGSDWVARDATTGNYNVSSYPSGTSWGTGNYWIYGTVSATLGLDNTGNDGDILFDNQDATYVELGYTAFNSSGGTALWLEAYDAGGNLLDTDTGVSNLRYADGNAGGPGTLRVDWDGSNLIAYVTVHDSGNFWTIDDITTDATDIEQIPAPGAILLGTLGLGMVGWLKRRVA